MHDGHDANGTDLSFWLMRFMWYRLEEENFHKRELSVDSSGSRKADWLILDSLIAACSISLCLALALATCTWLHSRLLRRLPLVHSLTPPITADLNETNSQLMEARLRNGVEEISKPTRMKWYKSRHTLVSIARYYLVDTLQVPGYQVRDLPDFVFIPSSNRIFVNLTLSTRNLIGEFDSLIHSKTWPMSLLYLVRSSIKTTHPLFSNLT